MKLSRTMKTSWLIAVISLLVLIIGAYQVWLIWPSLVLSAIEWQREVNAELADLLYSAQSEPLVSGGYLVGFSFLYGMLHSLGPGHGKVIVSTYLATHPAKVRASLMLTIISAICQALVAILLVSVLIWGFNASMRVVNEKAATFVALSFVLVVVLGLLICWKASKQIYRAIRVPKLKVKTLTPITASPMMSMNAPSSLLMPQSAVHAADHSHDECGCGHQHVAGADEINQASTLREYVGIVASIGIRPCTGAIMALLFANMVGTYWLGVMSALAMAGGTALTTSIIAILTLTSKKIVKRYLAATSSDKTAPWQLAGYYVQLFGGLLLIAIGLLLFSSQDTGMSQVF
ncbi:nickel/cobalt transporter [Vibrio aquimaris]|uniref:Nickel/cobalt efflux system n=1 Tax=Vibrio aquimaris TaxID=2587862 RepID=A0A5P9CPZ3_9VIBR|nr:nickel/cobalt transporter [Vibrio aquimaris]QFT28260.1 High-affinity nickel-transport protein [Vibrio aquimaris]